MKKIAITIDMLEHITFRMSALGGAFEIRGDRGGNEFNVS
jgi:hypothetical protein